ncbi:hypothetical protein FRC03_009399 [Tulasnella sp. 419]|nr:hypothetical protein FRC02_011229 [Tulasnella sp. 418]KAG8958154.1 hypothetical protein FRC03_009399 [Tulasnella sp. 419]
MTALRRIGKELNDLNLRPIQGVNVSPKDDNLFLWDCWVKGPEDSPYYGGKFRFTIQFPENFPFKAPVVTFSTRIYHPGFNEEGHICLPMLRDEWKPAITIPTVLRAIQDKIGKPSADDPFDTEVAMILKNDEEKFKTTAREWVKKYAT